MQKMQKKSVFFYWFFSYIVILVFSILLSIGIYFYSFHIISGQYSRINQVLLEKLRAEVDGRIISVDNLLNGLLLDYNVQKAAKVQGSFSIQDRELLWDLYQDIQAKVASSDYLDDIIIYFNQTGTVLSTRGHMELSMLYHMYYQGGTWSYEKMGQVMGQRWNHGMVYLKDGSGSGELMFLQTAGNQVPGSFATIAMVVKEGAVRKWMADAKWDPSMYLFMFGPGQEVISTAPLPGGESAPGAKGIGKEETIKAGGHSYTAQSLASKVSDWSYGAWMPLAPLSTSAGKIQLFTFVGLVVFMTLGVAAAYFLTRFHYHPLKNVMDMLQQRKSQSPPQAEVKNEYLWLQRQMDMFFAEQDEARLTLRRDRQILRKHCLFRLVTRPYEEKQDKEALEQNGIYLKEPWNVVVLLATAPPPGGEGVPLEPALEKFIIANIFDEILSEQFDREMVDLGEYVGFIVNCKTGWLETREMMEAAIDRMQKWVGQQYHLGVSAFAGGFCQGLAGIYESFQMAKEAMEYQTMEGHSDVVWYDDVKNHWITYEYPIEMEQRIINAIKAGEGEAAFGWIAQVLRGNGEEGALTPFMRKCLIYDLLGTIIKGADVSGGLEFVTEAEMAFQWSSKMSPGQVEDNFHQMVDRLCTRIRQKEQEERSDRQFGRKVADYVDQNFSDPDLNLSITALHFNLTPSYLSALFKEQMGVGLLEYINQARVNKVKELLALDYSIVKITGMTGFRSSGALIRVFKKVAGITPGQMKKLMDMGEMDALPK